MDNSIAYLIKNELMKQIEEEEAKFIMSNKDFPLTGCDYEKMCDKCGHIERIGKFS